MHTLGVFILNLVCRDEKLREQVIIDLKQSFKSVCSYKLEEDVNEILYCRNTDNFNMKKWRKCLETASKSLNELSKLQKVTSEELIEVQDFLKNLKL